MHRKATVVSIRHDYDASSPPQARIRSVNVGPWDGGASPPIPPPFLGGWGDPTKKTGTFCGFLAVPRQGDELLIGYMGSRPVASYSATLGAFSGSKEPLPRFPAVTEGESGQWDGDGKRMADVFHADGSTTLFDFHGAGSITASADGKTITITAPNGLNIVGTVNITGTLKVNGVAVLVP